MKLTLIRRNDLAELKNFKVICLQSKHRIHGGYNLERTKDEVKWFKQITANIRHGDYLFVARDEKGNLVGIINFKESLSFQDTIYGGNSSFTVHPDFLNRGFGSEMVRQMLKEMARINPNLKRILFTVKNDNMASIKVIEKNSGKMIDQVEMDKNKINRYYIYTEK
ncbi:GNAT family N-acetyltransferase [Vagococcus vulneris]|uniref:N-acetyltransferase domain-containing protein n=1 Tax=Vagococcus vulneris TaxID=1977869 RepID=A0A430A288_9ENTE|nr:GNAT family N-acetyltransferase [Vagococcus vulneris]RSU00550.1 hypothetical protein CBF37_00615 [Vagococcus vulneris]